MAAHPLSEAQKNSPRCRYTVRESLSCRCLPSWRDFRAFRAHNPGLGALVFAFRAQKRSSRALLAHAHLGVQPIISPPRLDPVQPAQPQLYSIHKKISHPCLQLPSGLSSRHPPRRKPSHSSRPPRHSPTTAAACRLPRLPLQRGRRPTQRRCQPPPPAAGPARSHHQPLPSPPATMVSSQSGRPATKANSAAACRPEGQQPPPPP